MCGIIGVTGSNNALAVLLQGLRTLEYRGYDSAGVALVQDQAIWRRRSAHGTVSVSDLDELTSDAPKDLSTGIGHTRWATHGHPSIDNAHPFVDCTGRLALVHNGIIENHSELALELESSGHTLSSATDSEVIVHLIEGALAQGCTLADSVRSAMKRVRGSFTIAVVHSGDPDLIVAACRDTPLVVGLSDGMALLASDIPALLGRTHRLFTLEDDQVAELRPGSVLVTDVIGNPVEPIARVIDWDIESAQKEGFEDFMSKEIREQPRAVSDTLLDRRKSDGSLVLDETTFGEQELAEVERVVIVACGSSYHAAKVAEYAIEHWSKLPTEVDIASEFRYRDPILDRRTLVVGVSQSGETLDTLQAIKEAGRLGARVLAVSNVVDSSMARSAEGVLYTRAGPEVGVAATKTFLSQIIALELLALTLAQAKGSMSPQSVNDLLDQMHELPEHLSEVLERAKEVDEVANALFGARDFFYLGRNVGYPVAMEGALKLKELAYLRAEGYPAGELKHGPIALIEPGTVVVGVATRNKLWEKFQSNIEEVKSRGATVVLVGNDGDAQTAALADHMLWVPTVEPLLSAVIDVVPLQLLAYRLARLHGHDVDRPRNLAKTVTVE